jgi:glutamate dehydrogenase (NADP+)
MMAKFGKLPSLTTVAVQGFGNAGSVIARLLFDAGYKVVAVSDSKGGVYAPGARYSQHSAVQNLHPQPQGRLLRRNGMQHHARTMPITNEELLTLDVDILIPAALENQITAENADAIQARYIFEVANGPITSEADRILEAKHIYVFPDILVNAGGVTVSYFEWVQNRSGLYWSREEVSTPPQGHDGGRGRAYLADCPGPSHSLPAPPPMSMPWSAWEKP